MNKLRILREYMERSAVIKSENFTDTLLGKIMAL